MAQPHHQSEIFVMDAHLRATVFKRTQIAAKIKAEGPAMAGPGDPQRGPTTGWEPAVRPAGPELQVREPLPRADWPGRLRERQAPPSWRRPEASPFRLKPGGWWRAAPERIGAAELVEHAALALAGRRHAVEDANRLRAKRQSSERPSEVTKKAAAEIAGGAVASVGRAPRSHETGTAADAEHAAFGALQSTTPTASATIRRMTMITVSIKTSPEGLRADIADGPARKRGVASKEGGSIQCFRHSSPCRNMGSEAGLQCGCSTKKLFLLAKAVQFSTHLPCTRPRSFSIAPSAMCISFLPQFAARS